ncbi:MAG TPA: hypothetical protein VG324_03625 [Blastocatellia bacterium]|nr:hypothetical protein [Blastocatellia bacterium]
MRPGVCNHRFHLASGRLARKGHWHSLSAVSAGVFPEVFSARAFDFNLSIDNLTDKRYFETQNYFESRVSPGAEARARIHGTPGYPVGVALD